MPFTPRLDSTTETVSQIPHFIHKGNGGPERPTELAKGVVEEKFLEPIILSLSGLTKENGDFFRPNLLLVVLFDFILNLI